MANTKQMTIDDVKLCNVNTHVEDGGEGSLSPIQSEEDVPFKIERVFYVFGVKAQSPRGCHAHYKTQQLLICLNGEIEIVCKDGFNEKRFLLDSPQRALYLPTMIWDEQVYKSPSSILLSICSSKYDPKDYIHDYEKFQLRVRDPEN